MGRTINDERLLLALHILGESMRLMRFAALDLPETKRAKYFRDEVWKVHDWMSSCDKRITALLASGGSSARNASRK